MPKSTSKHVLIARHPHGKGTATYPVSVHVNKPAADAVKAHAAGLVASKDVEALKALLPTFKTAEDGTIPTDVKWAVVVLPYDPTLPGVEASGNDFEV